jgi:thiamine-phosphate pyrophosphorylase
VCYVTGGKSLGAADRVENVLPKIRGAIAAGVDWVQIREKDLPTRDLLSLVLAAGGATEDEAARGLAQRPGKVRVFVNDRLDIALAAGAAGVHLGGESVPAREAIRWCRSGNAPAEFMIGVSCHDLQQSRAAQEAGASYLFFGPIFDTPSKRAFGTPQGIAKLAEICSAIKIPVIAIGGVSEKNGAECNSAGAAGIAAIRLFQEHGDEERLRKAVATLHGLNRGD